MQWNQILRKTKGWNNLSYFLWIYLKHKKVQSIDSSSIQTLSIVHEIGVWSFKFSEKDGTTICIDA